MKLLHLADLHLGRSLGDYSLFQDQKYILDQILAIAVREAVDGVLIAGDVYDKSIPSEAATRLLDGFLRILAESGICTYMISGNHDSDDRLQYGSTLFASSRIYISAVFDGHMIRHTLEDGQTAANIYLLPFIKASQVRHYYPEVRIETYEDAVRTVLENADIKDDQINIMVAHQFVTGSSDDPALGGSEGAGAKSVGTVEKIGYDCFHRFDYVALGHIHSPQQVGRPEIRYAGSPLKYSLSEAENHKSVPLITIEGKGNITIDLLPLSPLRDLRHVRGKLADLLQGTEGSEDFLYATLTDEDFVDEAMTIFRQVYPNTVKIDYDNTRTREVEQVDISQIAGNRSFDELIGEFYRQIYQCDISEEEMAIMRMAAREAGVIDATD